jgi:hypothetical protein
MSKTGQTTGCYAGWGKGYIEWFEDNTAYISVVFSWLVERAQQRVAELEEQGLKVLIGGPAVAPRSGEFLDSGMEVITRHNPNATFTSRGCIRNCGFCLVPKVEGELKELKEWIPRPIVCDNNLLACSKKHFNLVIDRLKGIKQVDFNQGFDARLMTQYHAARLAELDLKCLRLAWDHVMLESKFRDAVDIVRAAHIPKSKLRSYVLIGYNDTPDDALYRLESLWKMGILPNPMRYQPIDTAKKNSHVAPGWTNSELIRFMRYWSNLRITRPIPFVEFEQLIPCFQNHE